MLLSRTLRLLSKRYVNRLIELVPEMRSDGLAEIMLALADDERPLTQKELCNKLEFDKSRTAIMIWELNNLAYVQVEQNPVDRREHFVSLTKGGNKLVRQIRQAIAQVNGELDIDQAACLFAALYKLGNK